MSSERGTGNTVLVTFSSVESLLLDDVYTAEMQQYRRPDAKVLERAREIARREGTKAGNDFLKQQRGGSRSRTAYVRELALLGLEQRRRELGMEQLAASGRMQHELATRGMPKRRFNAVTPPADDGHAAARDTGGVAAISDAIYKVAKYKRKREKKGAR